jgi:hypothetical protein
MNEGKKKIHATQRKRLIRAERDRKTNAVTICKMRKYVKGRGEK